MRWEVPPTWAWAEAGEIAAIVGGSTPTAGDAANFADDGIPWLTPADLTGYKETYIRRGARSLSQRG
jgi:type I restriction enzyme S subunit